MNIPEGIEGKASWLTIATSARVLGHPLVWSAMTAIFILVGYFWLQYYALPYSTELAADSNAKVTVSNTSPSKNDIGSDVKSHWNPDIYKDIETKEVMSISNEQDDNRAQDYRRIIALEAKLLPLLNKGSEYMASENYVLPENANAWHMYSQVLEIDSSHGTAKSAQQQILETLQQNAQLSVEEKQYEDSERWLTQLDTILPGNPFQTTLRNRIAEQINQELAQAEAAQKEVDKLNRLKAALDDAHLAMSSEPAKLRAAFDLYMRALEIEPDNSAAQSGLDNIHQIRIDKAQSAITLEDFDSAQQEIDRLLETNAKQSVVNELIASLEAKKAQFTELQLLAQEKQKAAAQAAIEAELTAKQAEKVAAQAALEAKAAKEAQEKETLSILTEPAKPTASDSVGSQGQASIDNVPKEVATLFPEIVDVQDITVNAKAKPLDLANDTNQAGTAVDNKIKQLNDGIAAYYEGNYNSAFELLHPLAEDGVARAQFRLGIMYFQGRTVVKNTDLATQWIARALPTILRAAQNNAAWAQSDLGTAYEMGIGVQKDLGRSATWYKKAADLGYAGAQTNLGVLYGTGEGVKYDRQLAVYWLKQAAEQGDKVAQDNLKILNAR